jgi:PTH1 family peptidyl-tRNA hydrolase
MPTGRPVNRYLRGKAFAAAIVGLGNPGRQYEKTRHNAGFQVVDELAGKLGFSFDEYSYPASLAPGVAAEQKVLLCKPLTFMNRSGEVVKRILQDCSIDVQRMLIVHDDLDMPCGRLKLAQRGGAAGHRGVLSLIEQLGHHDFPRLKLGIGRPLHGEAIEAYVLHPPYPEERKIFAEMIGLGAEAAETFLCSGLVSAMNRFNSKEFQAVRLPSRSA